jgi:hypothetical protein
VTQAVPAASLALAPARPAEEAGGVPLAVRLADFGDRPAVVVAGQTVGG